MTGRPAAAPAEHRGECGLPRRSNYSFEKRRRELAKAEKKAARLEARARTRQRKSDEGRSGEGDGQADDGPPEAEENSQPG